MATRTPCKATSASPPNSRARSLSPAARSMSRPTPASDLVTPRTKRAHSSALSGDTPENKKKKVTDVSETSVGEVDLTGATPTSDIPRGPRAIVTCEVITIDSDDDDEPMSFAAPMDEESEEEKPIFPKKSQREVKQVFEKREVDSDEEEDDHQEEEDEEDQLDDSDDDDAPGPTKNNYDFWTKGELRKLLVAQTASLNLFGEPDWNAISAQFPSRTPTSCNAKFKSFFRHKPKKLSKEDKYKRRASALDRAIRAAER